MNKKVFSILVILMSLSLIGIIFVQAYYINNALETKEEQFSFNVNKALNLTANQISEIEYQKYVLALNNLVASGQILDSTAIRQLSVFNSNTDAKSHDNTLVNDSLDLTKLLKLDHLQRATFEAHYREEVKKTPLSQRVNLEDIDRLLRDKLSNNGINIAYEFAIFDRDSLTSISSKSFKINQTPQLKKPLFSNIEDANNYSLHINFPKRKRFIMSSILGMTLLSILFTVIIIIAYTSALSQLIQQRKISQMKSDFINNMTHEFKTPIATINLALDAIANPIIFKNQDKVRSYLSMIKDENKRMNAQVENVLRISQLQKHQLIINKDRLKLHDLIQDAITHVELIVADRKGYINTDFKAQKSSVLANNTYLTNVIINLLDNAVKYSEGPPKIDIITENVGNNILLYIRDQGIGISKPSQKRIFEEFYREHTGDVHNVKGHGLGLANVKRIVENHQGVVTVDSEKGKGSTFIIKLPLIT